MRSIYLFTRQEMNTGSIGRSMNRILTELQNPNQMKATSNTYNKLAIQWLDKQLCFVSSLAVTDLKKAWKFKHSFI